MLCLTGVSGTVMGVFGAGGLIGALRHDKIEKKDKSIEHNNNLCCIFQEPFI